MIVALAFLAVFGLGTSAGDPPRTQQTPGQVGPPTQGRGGFGGPIVLAPDDIQVSPEPADDINANKDVPHAIALHSG